MTIIDILNILQRVMITGATSGIGQALADELLGVGCRIILAGRDSKKLEKIKEELEKTKLPANASLLLPQVIGKSLIC